MATKRTTTPPPAPAAPSRPPYMLIEEIRVQGYKSLVDATLHVRPLTLLAGTNSSGKSSIMQPLLLIKQTIEASYKPAGALILNGVHVQVETAGELISRNDSDNKRFSLSIKGQEVSENFRCDTFLQVNYQIYKNYFEIVSQKMLSEATAQAEFILKPDSTWEEIRPTLQKVKRFKGLLKNTVGALINTIGGIMELILHDKDEFVTWIWRPLHIDELFLTLMHIPGLRRKPERSYANSSFITTFFRNEIKGTFDLYTAGTISQWQQHNETEALAQLNNSLQRLGLTNAVTAKVKNANEVELSVNRLPSASKAKPRKADMVNIADVGIGVSQVLPILVALIAAQEGQIVYVEQPELHLHPRAQVAMGELLAEAANRGVRVIVETHSSLLLLTVQTLIAQSKIANTDVGLHWFTRDAKGASQVQYVQPDEDGAYGEWPEDFSEIELKAQDAYLTAVGLRQFGEAAQ